MYFLVSSTHWPEAEEEDVGLLDVLVPESATLLVAGVDAGVVAALAALLLTTTPAAAEDELVPGELGLELEGRLAFEETLELVFVLKVVGTAEELVFGMLETLFEAEEAALELSFWLDVESTLEADLAA